MMELSGYRYTCAAGDTFDSVALAVYEDENFAAELMTANPKYSMLMTFTGGEELALPVVEKIEQSEDTPYAPSVAPWKEE